MYPLARHSFGIFNICVLSFFPYVFIFRTDLKINTSRVKNINFETQDKLFADNNFFFFTIGQSPFIT